MMARTVVVIVIEATVGRRWWRLATVVARAAVKFAAVAGAERAFALGLSLVGDERGDPRSEQDGEQYFFHVLVLDSTRAANAYSTNGSSILCCSNGSVSRREWTFFF